MAEPSKILGNYEWVEEIGRGAEGRVLKAVCIADGVTGVRRGEMVAIKRLIKTGHEKESQQFKRQIEILSKLKHPNIVLYKDSFVWRENELEEDIHCLVMELLEGAPLKIYIKDTGLPWIRARQVLLPTLEALQYAAKNSIIHRDLKPSNIFITGDFRPKLIDFGIARQEDGEATATSSAAGAKGTFNYMAPDFASQQGDFRGDERSDVFSFGIILYETLAGELPFPPLEENAIRGYFMRWLADKKPTPEFRNPVFRVLTNARTCISKCIDPNRELRLKTFDEVMVEFSKISYKKLKHGDEVFEFREWLGKGGFGEVFRARRMSDGRDVAIKRLFSAGQSSRFVREAKILRNAAHPNLTEYVDFVEVRQRNDDEREYYLVLEYLDGMPTASLRDRIKSSVTGLDPTEALELFVCYLDCLEHLHQNGIIHRDIKPGNLYAPPGNPQKAKIFDLGIAHDEEGTRTHGQVPGTLDFMPPEFATQSSGRGSPQSDIYSIGITLYQSLTKKLPFPRLPEKESEAWIAFFKRSLNPEKCNFDHAVFKEHPELIPLLEKSLAHDAAGRFPTAASMRDAIKKIVQPVATETDEDERPTAATVERTAPPTISPATETDLTADEAETKKADLGKIEAEMAAAAEKKQLEEAEAFAAEAETRKADLVKIEAEMAAQAAEQKRLVQEAEEAEAKTKKADLVRIEAELAAAADKKRIAEAEEAAAEAETRKADLAQIEAEMAAAAVAAEKRRLEEAKQQELAKQRRAVEEEQRKIREEEERLAAEAARQKKIEEDERRAVIRAERARQMRKTLAKVAKAGSAVAVAAALVIACYFGWNKAKVAMRENHFAKAVSQAQAAFRQNDFSGAIQKAHNALAIHTNDPEMQKLISDAQAQIKLHESYAGALANAQSAFASHDYTNAVEWAKSALQKIADDPVATKLQTEAQGFLDVYHQAVGRANAAYAKNDFAGASEAADRALNIYKDDFQMQQIKSKANGQLALQSAFRDTMAKAQAAFESHDYNNATALAGEALTKIPNEPGALKIHDAAQQYIKSFSTAIEAANKAFKNNDFTGAESEADAALAIFKNDDAMLKLKDNAHKQAQLHKAYSLAFKKAQDAFASHDFANAVTYAGEALKELPDEPNATKLRGDAQKNISLHAEAAANAQADYKTGNFRDAITKADEALAVFPSDAEMQNLKSAASKEIEKRQAYEAALASAQKAFANHDYPAARTWADSALQKIPDDPAATKLKADSEQAVAAFDKAAQAAQAAYQQQSYIEAIKLTDQALALRKADTAMQGLKVNIIKRLDARFVNLLESFNVTVPAELKSAEEKKASTFGAIGTEAKTFYLNQVSDLEKAYRTANCLTENNRQLTIFELSKAINNWE